MKVMKKRIFIGLRSILLPETYDELILQCKEAKYQFPDSFLEISLCGNEPDEIFFNLSDKVDHYSSNPIGLTPPLVKLVDSAMKGNYSLVILTDGDKQHIFSEIKNIFQIGIEEKVDFLIPIRVNRSLKFNNDQVLDRLTLEELENIYFKLTTNSFLIDPQPGLYIFYNARVLESLDLINVYSMIGDLVLTEQVITKKFKISEKEVNIRNQETTRMNLEREFNKIFQFEAYYKVSFQEIIDIARKDPKKYLPRGNVKSLNHILETYIEMKKKITPIISKYGV